MALLLTSDIEPFADINAVKLQGMIDDATAVAMLVAPCLSEEDDPLTDGQRSAAKAVLRGAILRWNDAGSGVVTQETAGPFTHSIDPRGRRAMFWPSEIEQLQQICRGVGSGSAFAVDTVANGGIWHSDTCALNFGANYCSCGAILSGGWPLWPAE